MTVQIPNYNDDILPFPLRISLKNSPNFLIGNAYLREASAFRIQTFIIEIVQYTEYSIQEYSKSKLEKIFKSRENRLLPPSC